MAMTSPRTRATARMSKRHANGDSGSPYDPAQGAGDTRKVATPGSNTTGSDRGLDANPWAKAPFAQRNRVEPLNTTANRVALVANAAQKPPTHHPAHTPIQPTTHLLRR